MDFLLRTAQSTNKFVFCSSVKYRSHLGLAVRLQRILKRLCLFPSKVWSQKRKDGGRGMVVGDGGLLLSIKEENSHLLHGALMDCRTSTVGLRWAVDKEWLSHNNCGEAHFTRSELRTLPSMRHGIYSKGRLRRALWRVVRWPFIYCWQCDSEKPCTFSLVVLKFVAFPTLPGTQFKDEGQGLLPT